MKKQEYEVIKKKIDQANSLFEKLNDLKNTRNEYEKYLNKEKTQWQKKEDSQIGLIKSDGYEFWCLTFTASEFSIQVIRNEIEIIDKQIDDCVKTLSTL